MRRTLSWVLLVLGALFLALSIPAGYVNRTVLDAPTFASNVDELRQRPDVSAVLGRELATTIIEQNPNLVAIAPLVDQISTAVVAGDALSGPTKLAASQFNRALMEDNSSQFVLRLADAGAVVSGVVAVVAPDRVPRAADVSVTLVDVGSQAFAADIIRSAGLVDTFAWLFPLLAVAFLSGAVALHEDRWHGIRRVGWAAISAMVALAVAIAIAGVMIRALGDDPRTGALVNGVWDIFVRPIWLPLGLVAGLAAVLIRIGSGLDATIDVRGLIDRVTARPTSRAGLVLRALALVTVGVAFIVEPRGSLTLLASAGGVVLVVAGVGALAHLGAAARPAPATDDTVKSGPDNDITASGRSRATLAIVAGVGVVALLAMVVWAARPPDSEIAGAVGNAVAGEGKVCNGHAELCDKRFDEVSYAAAHNAMSVAGKPGWYLGEQALDIIAQLDYGVRALLVDVWYGTDAGNGNVRTAAGSYGEALKIANEELGPDVVHAALRVFDAVAPGDPQGPGGLYMCHGLCETGSTSFDDTLGDIRGWLATHPDEVMTIFVEDHVDTADIGKAIIDANLGDYLYTPEAGTPFPTLGDMIRSGKRLVVMVETGDGRPDYPWLVNGFDFTQETPYTFPTVDSFSCEPNRGRADAPLLQINHWLSGFTDLVSDAQKVNTADVLGARAEQCKAERGLQPTFVAVNFTNIGDLLAVVDTLNGVG